MSNLMVDTNVVLDLLAKREPFYDSAAKLFSLADKKKITLSISSLTFANTSYVLARLKKADKAREILRRFRVLARVLSLDDKIIDLALNDLNFKDFEDGLQYYTALENGQEMIITRNLSDFKGSRIPVMTPEEYLVSIEWNNHPET
jgi:predicted nucleic acid-binding protein